MTADLVFLLALLVGFLTIAIGGLSYFLWRIAQMRIEAVAIEKAIEQTRTELDQVQGELDRIARFLNI